jgi:TolA-binding protein
MKKGILICSVLLIGLFPAISFGATSTATSSSARERAEDRFEEMKEEREAGLQARQEERTEQRSEVIEKLQANFNRFNENLVQRFEAAVERLAKLASRIESRIAKMESQGSDMAESKKLLSDARVKLSTASSSVASLVDGIETLDLSQATSTQSFKGAFKVVKDLVGKAKSDLKAAHAALVDVIESMKPGRNRDKTGAQSTSTATTTSD